MIRSGGGLIMVFACVNNLFIQHDFSLVVGPHKSMLNGCCKTTCSDDGGGGGGVSGCGGGGGGCGGDGGGCGVGGGIGGGGYA